MTSRFAVLAAVLSIAAFGFALPAGSQGPLPAPETRTVDVVDDYHGMPVADPYRWLEPAEDPEVRSWEDAQDARTRAWLERFPERERIREELRALYASHAANAPRMGGERYFFERRDGEHSQPRLFLWDGSPGASERVVLDPNTFSADGTVALDWYFPSPDGRLLAFGRSEGGSERSVLHVLDVDRGELLPDRIPHTRASSVAWEPDGGGFHYARYPAPGSVPEGDENYHRNVYHHRLGADPAEDPLVFGADRPREEWKSVSASRDGRHLFFTRSLDWTRNDLFLRSNAGPGPLLPVAVGLDGFTQAQSAGDWIVLRTNVEAPRYRIVRAPATEPGPERWETIVPEGEGVIQEYAVAGERIVLHRIVNAGSELAVHDLEGRTIEAIELPAIGRVNGLRAGHGDEVLFTFESFAYPEALFRYDLAASRLERIEQAGAGIDADRFVTRQLWFESRDGTRVPMFVVHRKGVPLDGDRPTLLYGYGGFNISRLPRFDRSRIPWLERGGVYAVANLRGGGEFGRAWHEAGRLEKKQNVFDDFIAAAEALIERGYTRPARLAVDGRSNGGLLTGAVLVQRPELFGAVHVGVPLLDMLRYHRFSIARLWIPEYGSADDPEQFRFLHAYSPYHRVRPGTAYPAVLLTTGDTDTRVDPMHARKMTARLQAATSGAAPILFRTDRRAGHGRGKPLEMVIEEKADLLVFLLWGTGQLGPGASSSRAAEPAVVGAP